MRDQLVGHEPSLRAADRRLRGPECADRCDSFRPRMQVGVPKESAATEHRVALVPETVGRLGEGVRSIVEPGAGAEAVVLGRRLPRRRGDGRRSRGRPRWSPRWRPPTAAEVALLQPGQVLIAFLQPLTDREGVERLRARGVHGLALESIPRTTRAQPMDALSSQATVAGYKAVLLAADRLPRFMPMLMTAAGTIPPAKVLVLGAGVAGLQAIATARRLGGVVSGFDVRPAVREQVESLGATLPRSRRRRHGERGRLRPGVDRRSSRRSSSPSCRRGSPSSTS